MSQQSKSHKIALPKKYRAVGHPPPDIEKLICKTCWGSPFWWNNNWTDMSTSKYTRSSSFLLTTPAWAKMQQLIKSVQCAWCSLISKAILEDPVRKAPPQDGSRFQIRVRLSQYFEFEDGSVIKRPADRKTSLYLNVERLQYKDLPVQEYIVHSTQGDPASKFLPQVKLLPDINSTVTHGLIRERTDRCFHHAQCPLPRPALLPTRTINCEDPEHPWLFINRQCIEDKYVALSYVWGCAQPHCTTGQNLESYIKGIPLEYIPKTIMDAIAVTRDLGFRYLWVDAFCIIQDSKDDKAQEIRQIRWLFSDAYLTIIAACADTVNDGFLHERHPPIPTPIMLPFRCPDGAIGTMQLRSPFDPPGHPVDKRAWCLEEHLLSPCKVIYTAHTLRYACEKSNENLGSNSNLFQDNSDMLSLSRPIYPDVLATSNSGSKVDLADVTFLWKMILNRLNALAGVAEEFQVLWPDSRYIAGLWEHQLPGCLLWQNVGGAQCYCRPNCNCAPLWYWASMDGEVDVNIYNFSTDEILCTIIQCDAVVAHKENPYGDVKGSTLVLEAVLISAIWDTESNTLSDVALCMPTESSQSPEWHRFEDRFDLIPDTLETVSRETCRVQLVMIKLVYDILQGLVLVPTDQSSMEQNVFPTFRRVGFFDYGFRTKSPDIARLSCAHQHIKII
ncbi:heterokaryon incompatibility protein-domain-containing protein [Armillaria luteobubalina]|uniref:Heterokaryon incompatibility protein-domain-containing protein n=1 Tax=Armillaria luteobubalina TaxID=153913 RepID=A0AA39UE85_9AGAR|nr:heterokaryon incompatibility protein-domain-containing protein [Armillaria luteobubalina]